MKFAEFLSEVTFMDDSDLTSIKDKTKLVKMVQRAVSDLNLTLESNSVYMLADDGNKLGGVFIYSLNDNDEKYISSKYKNEPTDYFYIGQFVYNIENDNVNGVQESTTSRYDSVAEAKTYIINKLNASQVSMSN